MFLSESDIQVGRSYRAVKPRSTGMFSGLFNDRTILWMSHDRAFVQYDGPEVDNGRRYPKMPMSDFLKWALRDVTDELPPSEWQRMDYESMKAESQKRRTIKKAAKAQETDFGTSNVA